MSAIAALASEQQIPPVVSEPVVTWAFERICVRLPHSSLWAKMLDVTVADVQWLCLAERAFAVLHCDEPLLDARVGVDRLIELQVH